MNRCCHWLAAALLGALPAAVLAAPARAQTAAPTAAAPGESFDLDRPEIASFVDEVAKRDGFRRRELRRLLGEAQPQPKIIDIMTRPIEQVAPWWQYRAHFVTPERIDEGVQFWLDHRLALEQFAAQYQVPPEYLVAIIGTETRYGRNTGSWRTLDALATLAFDYPPRAHYFRGELEQFLLLARENKLDPRATRGSYAGALGVPQFMPSVYRRYAVDADAGRRCDLWDNWDDILASVGNYLQKYGWQPGGPVLAETILDPDPDFTLEPHNLELNQTVAGLGAHGVRLDLSVPPETPALLLSAEQPDGPLYRVGFHNFFVLTRYNNSARYGMAVYDLAQAIAQRVRSTPPP